MTYKLITFGFFQDTLLNIHLSLEEFRAEALKSKSPMPVTLCIGGTQSGRITAVETLLNYNLRQASDEDKKIFYVDLNLSQNLLSIPGSIGNLRKILFHFIFYHSPVGPH